MTTDARYWMEQQAMERLAQHIPFEADPATKAELIEMLRGLALRVGRHVDREDFGFEARQELQRLGLWDRLGGSVTVEIAACAARSVPAQDLRMRGADRLDG